MGTLEFHEPHKFSAGALALIVHGIFFSLLYFGINWHVKTPQGIVVDMWEQLPEPAPDVVPPPPLPPIEPVAPKIEPVAPKIEPVAPPKPVAAIEPPKAEIEVKEKKKTKKVKQPESIKQEPARPQNNDKHLSEENARIQELKAKMRAEANATTQREVDRYKEMIQAKIRRNIVMPPDVAENAEAVFLVVVLPGGLVMDNARLLKSSGNTAYDDAAERAIYKAQPLPVPQDASLARMFRELRLSLRP